MKLYDMVKYGIEICFNMPCFFQRTTNGKKIVLFLTPQYFNMGDHAIAVSERQFLKNRYADMELLEINVNFYELWRKRVKKMIGKEDVIVITGGGYMGNMWTKLHHMVEDIILTFPENKIVFAPQTIYFDEQSGDKAEHFEKILKNHGNVYPLAREENTYHFLIKEMQFLPQKECGMMPDMVLLLNPKYQKQRKGVGVCLRSDQESVLEESDREKIRYALKKCHVDSKEIKMAYDHVEIPTWMSKWQVERKLLQFADKRVIVTDRLHGMIFAAITATPCIVFDNCSKKISGVYEKWMKDLKYIKIVNNLHEYESTLEEFLNSGRDYQGQMKEWQKKIKADCQRPLGNVEEWYGKNT